VLLYPGAQKSRLALQTGHSPVPQTATQLLWPMVGACSCSTMQRRSVGVALGLHGAPGQQLPQLPPRALGGAVDHDNCVLLRLLTSRTCTPQATVEEPET